MKKKLAERIAMEKAAEVLGGKSNLKKHYGGHTTFRAAMKAIDQAEKSQKKSKGGTKSPDL